MSGEKEFIGFEFQNNSNIKKTVQNSPVSAIRKSNNDDNNDNNGKFHNNNDRNNINNNIKNESNNNDTENDKDNSNNNNKKDLNNTFSDSESENDKLERYINRSYQDSTSIKNVNEKTEKPLTKTESLNSFDSGSGSSLNIKYGHTTDNNVSKKLKLKRINYFYFISIGLIK